MDPVLIAGIVVVALLVVFLLLLAIQRKRRQGGLKVTSHPSDPADAGDSS